MTTTLQPTLGGVRKAAPADSAAVGSALAAAFYDDPVFGWITPDDARRAAVVPRAFDLFVEVLAPHDDIWTTTSGVTGAACWVPYGRQAIPEDQAEDVMGRLAEISGPDAGRMLEVVALLDEHHPHEPHEYLWFVGVVPAAQGRGIGAALMAPVLERADRAGVPAYLEATSPRNKALYERHGFVAREAIAVAGAPPIWPMWREPA
ncbi:MAG TPA: GNAT family N-acetyltransferase [Pseudonocardia sp.]|nr:GNAT family N-acetyltransferase [Pseudonocardia sp.]